MKSDPPKVYWDSCVFIDYIDQQQNPDRILNILAVWEAARNRDVTIHTSMVSIVEVAYFVEEKTRGMKPESETKLDALWFGSPVIMSEVSPLVARDARGLVRRSIQDQQKMAPMDAVHLATAKRLGVGVVHTYDGSLTKYSSYIGVPIEEPSAAAPFLSNGSGSVAWPSPQE